MEHWVEIAAVIGAVSGLIGAISGGYSLWLHYSHKIVDLRVSLRKDFQYLQQCAVALEALFKKTTEQRIDYFSKQGKLESADFANWIHKRESDYKKISSINFYAPPLFSGKNFSRFSRKELQEESVKINGIHTVFNTTTNHCFLAIAKHQIRWVANYINTLNS